MSLPKNFHAWFSLNNVLATHLSFCYGARTFTCSIANNTDYSDKRCPQMVTR